MFELFDQSDPNAVKYRCTRCHEVGISNSARMLDETFWVPNKTPGPVPGRWEAHRVCDPKAVAAADAQRAEAERTRREHEEAVEARKHAKTQPAAPAAAPEPEPEVEIPAPKRRGRPRKEPALTEPE